MTCRCETAEQTLLGVETYIVTGLDLLDSLLIKFTRVPLEVVAPDLFDTILITAVQTALVSVLNPREMVLDLNLDDLGLQGDDVLALDYIGVFGSRVWGGEDRGEKGQNELEGEHVVDGRECDCCDAVGN